MKSAVTVSLVPQARGGPFVFWDDLAGACAAASALGFDAVEIFPPAAEAIPADAVRPLLERNHLALAAVGTGGGWLLHKLTLTSGDASVRARAVAFVRSMIDAAGRLGAPVIVGSMQGKSDESVSRDAALALLAEALNELGMHARQYGVPLFYEPLNRYETNLLNSVPEAVTFVRGLTGGNVKVLADLFHMNIEEPDVAAAIRAAAGGVGHVHLADSNRRPAGNGHTDFASVAAALRDIGYTGYLSAECLSWPDPQSAARQTIDAFRRHFANR